MKSPILSAIFVAMCLIRPAFAITYEELNAIFGIPIWADDNLWDDDEGAVAARLSWPLESKTAVDSSYRKFPDATEPVLEVRPHALTLYGKHARPARIFMMFANKIDRENPVVTPGDVKAASNYKKLASAYKTVIREDSDHIARTLTAFLGAPVSPGLAQGGPQVSMRRWSWNGHAILLTARTDNYVALQILPPDAADALGMPQISRSDLEKLLPSRIEKRVNGDVILKELPLVNSPKPSYRNPANWERVMRYMAIPADMHVIAMGGDKKNAGGSENDAIQDHVQKSVAQAGFQLTSETGRISVRTVKKHVDSGIPLIWMTPPMSQKETELMARMEKRALMGAPAEWKKSLGPERAAAQKTRSSAINGEMQLIIGYNEATGEIALSDGRTPDLVGLWITEEEALALSQEKPFFIK